MCVHCVVGRRSSTVPAATTIDGDAVAVQSTSCSRPNYAGQRLSIAYRYRIGRYSHGYIGLLDVGAKPVSVVLWLAVAHDIRKKCGNCLKLLWLVISCSFCCTSDCHNQSVLILQITVRQFKEKIASSIVSFDYIFGLQWLIWQ